MQRVTLRHLADKLDLSMTTVSRALKQASDVSPATIDLVRKVARDMGYRVNQDAVSLRTGKTYRLCALMPDATPGEFGSIGFLSVIEGVTEGLRGTPYSLSLLTSSPGDSAIDTLRRVVEDRMCDGIILSETRPKDARLMFLADRQFPFVTMGRSELFTPHSYVDADCDYAARTALAYLAGRGHRRIAGFFPPREFMYAQQLAQGWQAAHRDLGLPFDPDLAYFGPLGPSQVQTAAATLLHQGAAAPTAAFTASEIADWGLQAAVAAAGLESRFEIVSCDGSGATQFLARPVSALTVSFHDMGKLLGATLVAVVGGQSAEVSQYIVTPTLMSRL